jgi:hypothetical protein
MRMLHLTSTIVTTGALAALLAGAAQADVKVGVTAAVNPQAIGQPPTEPERVLMIGTDNFANEKITTGPDGQVQLLFVDGSSVSVGPNGELTIDQFVYDPNTKKGKLAISATHGFFRLVGGAISKSDEVTLTTPAATIGIRGGIVIVDSRANQPAVARFLFGQSMRVTAANVTQEVGRVGFQVTVPGIGQAPLPPVKITVEEMRNSVSQFQGRRQGTSQASGQTGGQQTGGQQTGGQQDTGGQQAGGQGNEPQQDQALASSGLSNATGSSQAPVPFPVLTVFNPNNQTQVQNIVTTSTSQTIAQQSSAQTQLFGHFYSDQIYQNGSFNPSNGFATYNPGNNGNVVFTLNGSTLSFTLPIGNGQTQAFSIPFLPGQSVLTGNIPVGNGGTANGTVIFANDPSKFFAAFGTYTPVAGQTCNSGGGSGCGFGFFGGVPTQATASSAFPTSGYAVYTPVAIQTKNGSSDSKIPFTTNINAPSPGTTGVTVSPIFTVFGPTQPNQGGIGTNVQGSLWIQGTGSAQTSGLVGMTSVFFQEQNSTVAFAGGVVGMQRNCYTCSALRFSSAATSSAIAPTPGSGLTNGNAIYGSNANFIVVVPDNTSPVPNSPDVRNTGAAQAIDFNTLTSNGPNFWVTAAIQTSSSSSTFALRTDTTPTSALGNLKGYTGGIMDIRSTAGTITQGTFLTNSSSGPISIGTSPTGNTMGAIFNFQDLFTSDQYKLQFGNNTGNVGTRSAFINDLIFASRDSRDVNGLPLSTVNGSTAVFNRLFMITSNVVPIDFQTFAGPGVSACVCAFMRWGWWIGEVQNPSTNIRERFNLATWVAGTMATNAEINGMSGSAVYNGHVIGNVAVNGGQYVAAGNMAASWSFTNHNGTWMATNFDRGGLINSSGISFSGTISGTGNSWNGGISGAGLSGSVNGSFFKNVGTGDPAAGIGGSWQLNNGGSNPTIRAAGTFAGQK